MECLTHKREILVAYKSVSDFSFQEKIKEQKTIDDLLDNILDLKRILLEKSNKLDDIVKRMEAITWFNNIDEACKQLINDIISSANDLHTTLVEELQITRDIYSKGIAKEEINSFEASVGDLKEASEDLESVFFKLPQINEFKGITDELSKL